jgi:hypothetical protein
MERARQAHERALRLRDDRMRAYTAFARVTKMVDATEQYTHKDIAEIHAEIELLTDNTQLRDAADRTSAAAAQARQVATDSPIPRWTGEPVPMDLDAVYSTPRFLEAKETLEKYRSTFIELAKEELGTKEERITLRESSPHELGGETHSTAPGVGAPSDEPSEAPGEEDITQKGPEPRP